MSEQSVRPHVYVDRDGAEWRCVDGELQVRFDDETDGAPGVGDRFSAGSFAGYPVAEFLSFLDRTSSYRHCVVAAKRAIADPMTEEDAAVDDEAIARAPLHRAPDGSPLAGYYPGVECKHGYDACPLCDALTASTPAKAPFTDPDA